VDTFSLLIPTSVNNLGRSWW